MLAIMASMFLTIEECLSCGLDHPYTPSYMAPRQPQPQPLWQGLDRHEPCHLPKCLEQDPSLFLHL